MCGFCSWGFFTFFLTKDIRSGGPEEEFGSQHNHCTHCPQSITTSITAHCHQSTEARWGRKEKILYHSTLRATFSSPLNTRVHSQQSPKEKVCTSAASLVYQELSAYFRDLGRSLWYSFRAVQLLWIMLQWWIPVIHLSKPIQIGQQQVWALMYMIDFGW